jgi:hypothetical protein
MKNLSQDNEYSQYPGWNLIQPPPEHMLGTLPFQPNCLVYIFRLLFIKEAKNGEIKVSIIVSAFTRCQK